MLDFENWDDLTDDEKEQAEYEAWLLMETANDEARADRAAIADRNRWEENLPAGNDAALMLS